MRAKEIQSKKLPPQYKLWSAPIQIKQPNYVGRIEATVTAANASLARQLIKAQYGVEEWHIGAIKEVK